jgi:hypothetical protein
MNTTTEKIETVSKPEVITIIESIRFERTVYPGQPESSARDLIVVNHITSDIQFSRCSHHEVIDGATMNRARKFAVMEFEDEYPKDTTFRFVSQDCVENEPLDENAALKNLLNTSVNDIGLPAHVVDCLNNANIATVGQLAMKSEEELLKYRNFDNESLNEIKSKLAELGLGLGMTVD